MCNVCVTHIFTVIAAIFYGDETWVANQTYSYGDCYANGPVSNSSTSLSTSQTIDIHSSIFLVAI